MNVCSEKKNFVLHIYENNRESRQYYRRILFYTLNDSITSHDNRVKE